MKAPEYKETNGIPICPYCQKPTRRSQSGPTSSTLMYCPQTFDEEGRDISTRGNISTASWQCLACGAIYLVSGNQYKGYQYIGLDLEETDDEQRTET